MGIYNRQDVRLTDDLYVELRGWIPNHPNAALYSTATELCCPVCQSTNYHSRGFHRTALRVHRRYLCQDCGKWFHDKRPLSITVPTKGIR